MGETMKIYFSVTKSYALMLCVTMLICFFLLGCMSAESGTERLENESVRGSYLSSLGFDTPLDFESKSVVIPLRFSESLEQYSDIMKKGGYNISECKGKDAMLYTYYFDDSIVHLLTHEDRLICADCFNIQDNKIYPLKERKNG